MSSPISTVGKAIGERMAGGQAGRMRAMAAAVVVGAGAAVATYKALRG